MERWFWDEIRNLPWVGLHYFVAIVAEKHPSRIHDLFFSTLFETKCSTKIWFQCILNSLSLKCSWFLKVNKAIYHLLTYFALVMVMQSFLVKSQQCKEHEAGNGIVHSKEKFWLIIETSVKDATEVKEVLCNSILSHLRQICPSNGICLSWWYTGLEDPIIY